MKKNAADRIRRALSALRPNILPSLFLMLLCLEILAIINGYILFSTGSSSGVWKYVGRELHLSLLLLLPAFLPSWPGKLYSVLLWLLLASLTAANWVHATLYNTPISSYLVGIFYETYVSEVQEFVRQYLDLKLLLHAAAPFALSLPLLVLSLAKRPRRMKNNWIPALAVLIIVGFNCLDVAPGKLIRRHYMGDLFLSCVDEWNEYKKFSSSIAENVELPSDIRNVRNMNRLIVLVIGEASGRNHYSLYGYPRPTTPNLEARKKELLVFSDVVAPHAHTIPALEKALTFANHEGDPARCSLVDILKAAGYYVITLSNQPQFGPNETASSRLLGRADETHFLNTSNAGGYYSATSHDSVLLKPLRQKASRAGDTAIILHLMGSHSKYSMRFPRHMARFADIPPDAQKHSLDKRHIQEINDYDNSVAYTDFILEQILRILEKQSRPTAFLFFSDHGEAMYEDGHTRGHAENAGSRYMFEIPFLIWLSPEYRKERPAFFERLKDYTARPWQTDDLIYPLLDLAGITFAGIQTSKNILSPDYIPEKRVMGGKDYDALFPRKQ